MIVALSLSTTSEEPDMTATSNQTNTNGNTNTNTNGNGSTGKTPRAMTAPEAIGKINKILEQLTAGDQKRVMAFFNATTE
jgi:hypothetical protein